MNLAYKKILGKFTKVLGFGKTPPPCWEKFPNNVVFFFDSVPKDSNYSAKTLSSFVSGQNGSFKGKSNQKVRQLWLVFFHCKVVYEKSLLGSNHVLASPCRIQSIKKCIYINFGHNAWLITSRWLPRRQGVESVKSTPLFSHLSTIPLVLETKFFFLFWLW